MLIMAVLLCILIALCVLIIKDEKSKIIIDDGFKNNSNGDSFKLGDSNSDEPLSAKDENRKDDKTDDFVIDDTIDYRKNAN